MPVWLTCQKAKRLASLDAFRGFVMLVLLTGPYTQSREGFGFGDISAHFKDSWIWQFLGSQFTHVVWTGCSFWDLIMPSFIFMVGVAMPYSYANRQRQGHSYAMMVSHALYRSVVFTLLGSIGLILLRNLVMLKWPKDISIGFWNVLAQIGLGYFFAFLVLGKKLLVQSTIAIGILAGYWLAFFLYPLPGPELDSFSARISEEAGRLTGFFAHWNKGTNLAADFDRWFLNLFPRTDPFLFSREGLQTLNFIPTISTMIFGIMTGEFLRGSQDPRNKLNRLIMAGMLSLAVGLVLNYTVCPIIKAIWTPSWTIYSSGWALWMLAAFFWLIEVKGYRHWAFPLVVVGVNSLAVYCMANIFDYSIFKIWEKFLGKNLFSDLYGPVWQSVVLVISLWLVSFGMYWRGVFVRI